LYNNSKRFLGWLNRLVPCLFAILSPTSLFAADFSSPESAIRSLESAYSSKDLKAVLAAKDFLEEARLMLERINPQLAADKKMLQQTAHVLELSFKQEIQKTGFPNFSELKCSFRDRKELTPNLVRLTEVCIFPDGGTSVQDLHVAKRPNGWRQVNVPK
jgi:hypothetical protein